MSLSVWTVVSAVAYFGGGLKYAQATLLGWKARDIGVNALRVIYSMAALFVGIGFTLVVFGLQEFAISNRPVIWITSLPLWLDWMSTTVESRQAEEKLALLEARLSDGT